jgi:hypothetical protein
VLTTTPSAGLMPACHSTPRLMPYTGAGAFTTLLRTPEDWIREHPEWREPQFSTAQQPVKDEYSEHHVCTADAGEVIL